METQKDVPAIAMDRVSAGDPGAAPRRLCSGVQAIDGFMGGFAPGRVTLLRGLHHAPTLLQRLLVLAVLDLDVDVVLVDGGNVADPFSLSAVCRRLRVRPREVMSRVHIARAFTSFQMSSILEDALPIALEEHAPGVLAITCVDELYHDDNVGRDQATVLLGRALDRVKELTEGAGLITLMADLRLRPRRTMDRFSAILDGRAHEVVTLERRSRRTLRLRRRDGTTAVLASPPPGQLSLDEFLVTGVRTPPPGPGSALHPVSATWGMDPSGTMATAGAMDDMEVLTAVSVPTGVPAGGWRFG